LIVAAVALALLFVLALGNPAWGDGGGSRARSPRVSRTLGPTPRSPGAGRRSFGASTRGARPLTTSRPRRVDGKARRPMTGRRRPPDSSPRSSARRKQPPSTSERGVRGARRPA